MSKKSAKKAVEINVETGEEVTLKILKIFSRTDHSENSCTVIWQVQWNTSKPVYEKRNLWRKGDDAETPYRAGKASGFTEEDIKLIINTKE